VEENKKKGHLPFGKDLGNDLRLTKGESEVQEEMHNFLRELGEVLKGGSYFDPN